MCEFPDSSVMDKSTNVFIIQEVQMIKIPVHLQCWVMNMWKAPMKVHYDVHKNL